MMNIILTMSSFIFPLITFPYVSRILLPTGTGKVSFATSVVSYFSMFAQLGIPTYGIRACAKVRENRENLTRTVHELIVINLIMSCISYFALFIALAYVPRLHSDRNLLILVSSTIILTTIGMEWLYKALEQYTYITIRSIIFKFIALIAMFLLIHKQSDYVIYGGITVDYAFQDINDIPGTLPAGRTKPWGRKMSWLSGTALKKCLKREYIRQICFRICDILEPWEITVALCFILREKGILWRLEICGGSLSACGKRCTATVGSSWCKAAFSGRTGGTQSKDTAGIFAYVE